jgi:hypothetical protein
VTGLAAPLRIEEMVGKRAGIDLAKTKARQRLQRLALVHVHEILTGSHSNRRPGTV